LAEGVLASPQDAIALGKVNALGFFFYYLSMGTYRGFSIEAPAVISNHFWIQVAVSLLY
jgi:hypothetical protein